MKFTFHLLGFPNYKIGWNHAPNNPFNTKLIYMVKMLKNLGHEVFVYGVENSEVDADKFISVLSEKDFNKIYGNRRKNDLDHISESGGPAWNLFIDSCIKKLSLNIKNSKKEFLLNFIGTPFKKITDEFSDSLIPIEPGIGHSASYLPTRIFESRAWQNYTYGKNSAPGKSYFPNNYDTVIPAYFDYRDYPFNSKKSDYYLYIGRVMWGKGLSVAIDITRELGAELVVIGGGEISTVARASKFSDISHVKCLGVLSMKDKVKYLSNARALIYYSLYVEPFGHAPVEAMMCGTPIITSTFGAFTETNQDKFTGYQATTYEEIYWACKNVDKLDPKKIREYAIKTYSLETIQEKYQKYFTKIYNLNNKIKDWYSLNKSEPIQC